MNVTLLDKEKRLFWSLPGTSYMVTAEDPSTEIDVSSLNNDQIKVVALAFQFGILTADNTSELEARLAPPKRETKDLEQPAPLMEVEEITEAPPPSMAQQKQTVMYKVERSKELKKLLKNKLPAINKVVPTLNVSDLRILLSLEQQGAKRKSLIKFAEKQINKLTSEVLKSVSEEDKSREEMFKKTEDRKVFNERLPSGYSVNRSLISEVEESDFEEIKIQL